MFVWTYNRAKYLNKCIDSGINQTFSDGYLIGVDDGRYDNSFDLVNDYMHHDQNIRYIKHKNRKQALSKNAGIQASFGEYLTCLDSDDTYKEHQNRKLPICNHLHM